MIEFFSVNRINKLSIKREIWCWGCGFQYGRMVKKYENEIFIEHIAGLIDTNENLQGVSRKIGNRKISVFAPNKLFDNINKKYLLIITSDYYEEICFKAEVLYRNMDIIYTKYPEIYYETSKVIRKIFCRFPLRRQLLFYVGSEENQPHENADEIIRYLSEEYTGKPYCLVYLTDYYCQVPNAVKQISLSDVGERSNIFHVLRYYFYYSTSQYIFYENTPVVKIHKRQKTIYLNHGTIPIKNVKDTLRQPVDLDYAICPGQGCASFYREQYSIADTKLIYTMPPRTKRIFVSNADKVNKLFDAEGLQIILWLPTFRVLERGDGSARHDSKVESPISKIFSSNEIIYINEILKENEQKLVIKHHPREKDTFDIGKVTDHIIIITDEMMKRENISLHSLMNRADALISDYSGITFEYMLLDKPLGYYIPDIEEYSRGFSVKNPLYFMPGEKLRSEKELLNFLILVKEGKDTYSRERRYLVEKLFGAADAENGSKEIIRFIEGKSNIRMNKKCRL